MCSALHFEKIEALDCLLCTNCLRIDRNNENVYTRHKSINFLLSIWCHFVNDWLKQKYCAIRSFYFCISVDWVQNKLSSYDHMIHILTKKIVSSCGYEVVAVHISSWGKGANFRCGVRCWKILYSMHDWSYPKRWISAARSGLLKWQSTSIKRYIKGATFSSRLFTRCFREALLSILLLRMRTYNRNSKTV